MFTLCLSNILYLVHLCHYLNMFFGFTGYLHSFLQVFGNSVILSFSPPFSTHTHTRVQTFHSVSLFHSVLLKLYFLNRTFWMFFFKKILTYTNLFQTFILHVLNYILAWYSDCWYYYYHCYHLCYVLTCATFPLATNIIFFLLEV